MSHIVELVEALHSFKTHVLYDLITGILLDVRHDSHMPLVAALRVLHATRSLSGASIDTLAPLFNIKSFKKGLEARKKDARRKAESRKRMKKRTTCPCDHSCAAVKDSSLWKQRAVDAEATVELMRHRAVPASPVEQAAHSLDETGLKAALEMQVSTLAFCT